MRNAKQVEKCIQIVIFKASLWLCKSALDSLMLDREVLVLSYIFIPRQPVLADKVVQILF